MSVYSEKDKVPKKYLNLRKAVYVTTFKHPYPNMADILINQYGLKPDEKIVIFWMKEVSLPHFNRYRLKFRKVYSGRLGEYKSKGSNREAGALAEVKFDKFWLFH